MTIGILEELLLEEEAEPDSRTVAVIAAAVAAFAGRGAVVRTVTPVPSPGWSRQGRVHLQSSHDVLRRRNLPEVKGAPTA